MQIVQRAVGLLVCVAAIGIGQAQPTGAVSVDGGFGDGAQLPVSRLGPRLTTAEPVRRLAKPTSQTNRGAACAQPPIIVWASVQRQFGFDPVEPVLIRFWSDDPLAYVEVGRTGMADEWISGMDFDAAGNLYAVSGQIDGQPTGFYQIDTITGGATFVGELGIPLTSFITDLSWDPSTNQMFALGGTDAPFGTFQCTNITQLWTIDLGTGAASLVLDVVKDNGEVTLGVGLATDANGTHYIQCHIGPEPIRLDFGPGNCTFLSWGTNRLYRLDGNIARLIDTPNWSLAPNFDQGMTIDWSGDGRWLWHEGELGSVQLVGIRRNDGTLLDNGLTFDPFDVSAAIIPTDLAIMPRSACPFDVDNSGTVDFDDLCAWHENPIDINGGGIDFDDAWCLARAIGVPFTDCNGNGQDDACEIALGWAIDCDANGVPDDCEVDENNNGVLDSCDIASGWPDADGDGVPDDGQSFASGREALAFQTTERRVIPTELTAISGDNLVVVALEESLPPGAFFPEFDTFAYLFERQGPRWVQTQRIAAPDPPVGSWFDVDMEGDTLIIGVGVQATGLNGAQIYRKMNGTWTLEQEVFTETIFQFWHVDLAGDVLVMGNQPGLGGNAHDDTPYIDVNIRDNGTWSETTHVAPDAFDPVGLFPVGLATDGQRIAGIGWEDPGPNWDWQSFLYVFRREGAGWVQEARLATPCNSQMILSLDIEDDVLAVRATACGGSSPSEQSVFIWKRTGTTWTFDDEVFATEVSPTWSDQVHIDNGDVYTIDRIDACGRYAPGVRIYEDTGSGWTQRTMLSTLNATSMAREFEVSLGGFDVSNSVASLLSQNSNGGISLTEADVAFVITETTDCDGNGLADRFEILSGLAADANNNGVPDICEACAADTNGDGLLDFFDVQLFLALFAGQDPASDLNNDGLFDFFDVQAYLNLYAAGCP
jgi:hypothetical protein